MIILLSFLLYGIAHAGDPANPRTMLDLIYTMRAQYPVTVLYGRSGTGNLVAPVLIDGAGRLVVSATVQSATVITISSMPPINVASATVVTVSGMPAVTLSASVYDVNVRNWPTSPTVFTMSNFVPAGTLFSGAVSVNNFPATVTVFDASVKNWPTLDFSKTRQGVAVLDMPNVTIGSMPSITGSVTAAVTGTVATSNSRTGVQILDLPAITGAVTMAQGPAGSASLITNPANLLTVAPSPTSTWTVVGTVTANVGTIGGVTATPFLDLCSGLPSSTPFRTAAAQATVAVLPMTTRYVRIAIVGTATDYCQCTLTTTTQSANLFVTACEAYNSPPLRLPILGATVTCGSGQGTHGLVSGSVTWSRMP